ncbi:hypothetical protein ACPPVO_51360 [Dactylosporangium sp. McL0621]
MADIVVTRPSLGTAFLVADVVVDFRSSGTLTRPSLVSASLVGAMLRG